MMMIFGSRKNRVTIRCYEKNRMEMSSTDGLIGVGIYNSEKSYQNLMLNLIFCYKNKYQKAGSKLMMWFS